MVDTPEIQGTILENPALGRGVSTKAGGGVGVTK